MEFSYCTEVKQTRQGQVWSGDNEGQGFTFAHGKSELQIRHLVHMDKRNVNIHIWCLEQGSH